MTAIYSTSLSTKLPSSNPSVINASRRPASPGLALGSEPDERRDQLQCVIRDHEARAQQAAEQGDLAQAARFILAALDGERLMASTGPQVLQLIKPRG